MEPLLLYGDPGTGKTSTAEVASNEQGWPLLSHNASDRRTSADMHDLAESMQGTPIDADYSIVLVGEVDSWSSGSNLGPLLDQLDDPTNPIILTANSEYYVPDSITRRCNSLKYSLRKDSIKAHLRTVADEANVDVDPQAIGLLASRGELRSAIQDLQMYSADSPDGFPTQIEGQNIDFDERDEELPVYEATKNVLEGTAYTGMDSTPPRLVRWLQHNLRDRFRLLEAGMAYEALSSADLQNSRVKDGNYRAWKFAGALVDQVANLRLTDPQYRVYAESPSWNNPPKSTSEKPEAVCYRTLNDSTPFAFSGGFQEFRREHLPVLRSLSFDERCRLALGVNLPRKALTALEIEPDDYDEWRETVEDVEDLTETVESGSIDIGDGGGMNQTTLSSSSESTGNGETGESGEDDEGDDDGGMDVLGDFG